MGLFFVLTNSKPPLYKHIYIMADEGSRGRGRGRGGFGDRGRGRGRGGPRRDKDEGGAWVPVTKLGRLVKDKMITSLEQIYLFSLPIKEYQIIDFFLEGKMKDEVMKIMPVQKQTRAGQRTRSRLSLSLVTAMVILAWESSAPRKLPPPSVVPSSWLNCLLCPFVVVSGVITLVFLTLSPLR